MSSDMFQGIGREHHANEGSRADEQPTGPPGTLGSIEACIPALRRHASVLLGGRRAADELVRTSLNYALDRLHTVRHGTNARTRLFSTMYRHFWTTAKIRRSNTTTDETEPRHGNVDPERNRLREWWIGELNMLPGRQREVVTLIAIQNLTYEQTSRALGLSLHAVLENLAAARDRLLVRSGTGPFGFAVRQDTSPWPTIAEENLHAYVDELLDPERQAAVERYLRKHPDAAELVAAYSRQRQEIRVAFGGRNLPVRQG